MQTDATYRGTVYPWQCDHVGHMNIPRVRPAPTQRRVGPRH